MKIELSAKFRKAYKKLASKKPEVAVIALEKILLFSQQPNNPVLKFHNFRANITGNTLLVLNTISGLL